MPKLTNTQREVLQRMADGAELIDRGEGQRTLRQSGREVGKVSDGDYATLVYDGMVSYGRGYIPSEKCTIHRISDAGLAAATREGE